MVKDGWYINWKSFKTEHPADAKKTTCKEWWDSILPAAGEYLYLISQESSMHGLAHVTARGRHPAERVVWLVVLLGCISGAIWVPLSAWRLLQRRPTVMSMERDYTSWNTSFPAVTLCPDAHIDPVELQLLASRLYYRLENVSTSDIIFFLNTLADTTINNLPSSPFADLPGIEPEEFLHFVLELAPSWTYTMKGPDEEEGDNDESKGVKMDPVITERGVCYSFNSALAPFFSARRVASAENETWTVEDIDRILNTPVTRINPLDGRVLGQVMKVAFGFTVFLHGPFEIADASAAGIKVQSGHINTLGLSGQEVFTTPEAAKLTPAQRKCRLPSEGPPGDNPPIYSFVLCRRRCRARLAKKLCGCVPHWDTFLKEGQICNVKGLRCLGNFQDELIRIKDPETNEQINCDCFPACDYVSYVVENREVTPWFLGAGLEYGLSKYPRARLKRDIFFTPKDVLVSFGSAAGLFLGCSVLSFVEFIYFFTLGLYWYIQKQRDAEIVKAKKDDNSRSDRRTYNHYCRKRFMSGNAWRRHFLDSGGSRTKLLAWIE